MGFILQGTEIKKNASKVSLRQCRVLSCVGLGFNVLVGQVQVLLPSR